MTDWTEPLRGLSPPRRAAMEFLRDTLPASDLDCYPFPLFLEAADHALMLRQEAPWCAALEEEIFYHYVLCPRVNDEDLSAHRALFHAGLWSRISGLTLEEKVLEVNRWCHEHAVYQSQDDRTASPLTVFLCGSGRCGEESAFLVAALRSVGIAARQVYAPRWSHCDDNHAWVEALCDGQWRFLGACEPEPILNRGWFNTAASRAMLIHSRTFGWGNSPLHGAYLGTEGGVSFYSQTPRYAKTIPYTFRATRDGQPAAGAVFRLQVLNESSFHTIATLTADERGEAHAALGIGDLHVTASLDGLVAEGDCLDGRVNLSLLPPAPGGTDWQAFDFLAPRDEPVNPAPLSEEQKRFRAAIFQRGNALRAARRASCCDPVRSNLLPGCADLLQAARGNFDCIYKFLHQDGAPMREKLVRSLSLKDLRDVNGAVLEDHLSHAAPYDGTIPEEIYISCVLCPRVALETLTPWRAALSQVFSDKQRAEYRLDPCALWHDLPTLVHTDACRTYAHLCWTPQQALQSGQCDRHSLRVLSVALLRAMGVPARLRPLDGAPEFWRDGGFHPASPESYGVLRLEKTPDQRPAYRQNWTLSRRDSTDWRLLTLSDGGWSGNLYAVSLPAGQYRLMTSVRLPNGNQFAAFRDFALLPGGEVCFPLHLRAFALEDLLGCQDMPVLPAGTADGLPVADAARQKGRPRLLFWIEEGNEPTEHVLNELSAGRAGLERLDVGITFLLRGPESLHQPTLAALLSAWPDIQVLFDDWAFDLDAVARHLSCDPDRPPLAVACNGLGQAVYAVSGYHVGSVELLTRIAEKLCKA